MKINHRLLYLQYIFIFIALEPIIKTVLTWNVSEKRTLLQYNIIHYSYISIALESLIIILVVTSGIDLTKVIKRLPLFQIMMIILVAASALLSAVSVVFNPDQVWIATLVWLIHFLFVYSLISISLHSNLFNASIFWKTVLISAIGYVLLVIIFVNAVPNPTLYPWVDHMPGVTNLRHIGYFLSPALAIVVGLYFSNTGSRVTLVSVFIFLACFGAWSGSKGIFFALVTSLPIALIIYPELRNLRRWLILFAALVIAIVLSTKIPTPSPQFGLTDRITQSLEGKGPELSNGRKMIWTETVRMIGMSPLIGYGAGMYRKKITSTTGYSYNHPHNLILQMLFQWGLIGAAGIFSLIVTAWLKAVKTAKSVGVKTAPALLVLNDLLAYSLFDGTGYYPWPITVMIIAVASILMTHNSALQSCKR
ncbi:MAG: O-antigen ligase family protein [Candidatus Thiodiazotropha sp. 6PLUC2]